MCKCFNILFSRYLMVYVISKNWRVTWLNLQISMTQSSNAIKYTQGIFWSWKFSRQNLCVVSFCVFPVPINAPLGLIKINCHWCFRRGAHKLMWVSCPLCSYYILLIVDPDTMYLFCVFWKWCHWILLDRMQLNIFWMNLIELLNRFFIKKFDLFQLIHESQHPIAARYMHGPLSNLY